jgi:hypothetical protein
MDIFRNVVKPEGTLREAPIATFSPASLRGALAMVLRGPWRAALGAAGF